jgi:hypothetical protein
MQDRPAPEPKSIEEMERALRLALDREAVEAAREVARRKKISDALKGNSNAKGPHRMAAKGG